jgi:hypothetical protein
MTEGAHIVRRAERPAPGERAAVEGPLVARLLRRGAEPSPSPAMAGEHVRVPEPTVRPNVRTATPGRPAPLLFRIVRRKLVIESSGPRRGGVR